MLGGLVLAAAWAAAVLRWWRVRARRRSRRRVRALSLVVPLSGLACAAAPLGFGIYRFVIESTARSIAVRITEWFPVLPTDFFGVLFWAATLGVRRAADRARPARVRAAASAPWADWVIVAAALRAAAAGDPLAAQHRAVHAARDAGGEPPAGRRLSLARRVARASAAKRAAPAPAPISPRLNLAMLVAMCVAAVGGRAPRFASGLDGLNWRPISDARAGGRARLRRAPLQPLRRRRHADLVPAREAGVRRRPPGSRTRSTFLLEFVAVEAGQRAVPPAVRSVSHPLRVPPDQVADGRRAGQGRLDLALSRRQVGGARGAAVIAPCANPCRTARRRRDARSGMLFVDRSRCAPRWRRAQVDTFWHLRAGEDIWRTHQRAARRHLFVHLGRAGRGAITNGCGSRVSYAFFLLGGMPLLTLFGARVRRSPRWCSRYRLTVGRAVDEVRPDRGRLAAAAAERLGAAAAARSACWRCRCC